MWRKPVRREMEMGSECECDVEPAIDEERRSKATAVLRHGQGFAVELRIADAGVAMLHGERKARGEDSVEPAEQISE